MIGDARDVHLPLDRRASLVIIGAGPCGLILARELSDLVDVLLIEAGGTEAAVEPDPFLDGETAGLDYPLNETRARQFGGSTDLWAGYCALFDRHDFEPRDWMDFSGWPFSIGEIAPYYEQAARVLNIVDSSFDAAEIARRARRPLRFEGANLAPTVWRFGTPTMRFASAWRADVAADAGITVLTNLSVTSIQLDRENGEVCGLVVRTGNGREGRIMPGMVVFAAGGIETARLLLHSDDQTAAGVGNSSGFVGQCFMEHPHFEVPGMHFHPGDWYADWAERGNVGAELLYASALGLSADAQRERAIMNARAHVYRTPRMPAASTPRLGLFLEQEPNRESRITLSPQTDMLGMRKARLDWRLSDLDWRTYRETSAVLADVFEAAGVGRFDHRAQPQGNNASLVLHSNHQLGTTRMSANKDEGVVDANCRMHDVSNAFVIGGSVFPTVSWANPTMTALALAYRLARYLRSCLTKL